MLRGRTVLLLLLALAPVQAASGAPHLVLTAEGFSSDAGIALTRWTDGDGGSFHLQAGSLSGTLTDEAVVDRVTAGGDLVEPHTGRPRTTTTDLPDGTRLASMDGRDTTLVVLPLDGPYLAQARSTHGAAEVLLRPVEHEVLEPDRRAAAETGDVTTAEARYEVQDVVTAATTDPSTVRVTGDFLLYVWDADFLYEGDGVGRVYRTGHWSEQGTLWSQRTEHHVHAVVVVRDGVLEVESPSGAALYGEVILLRGVGAVRAAEGTRQPPSETILATMPRSGSGTPQVVLSAAPTPPAPSAPPLEGPGVPASLALLAVAAVAAAPNLLGRRAWARGARPWANLRATRARGYVRLALAAERRHSFAAAAWWMGRAHRWDQDPELRMQRAIFLRMAGHPSRALRHHRGAEDLFRMDGCASALNAYEAARSAALVGRLEEAFTWLLAAVREEPWLAQRAPFEPDLAPLRSLPAFMDVSQALDPDGFLVP